MTQNERERETGKGLKSNNNSERKLFIISEKKMKSNLK